MSAAAQRPRGKGGRAREQERQQAQRRKDLRTLIIAGAVLLVLVVGAGVGYQVWRMNRMPSAVPERAETLTPVQPADGKPIRLGRADAPHVLTAWVDFHCPGCAGFEQDYGPSLFAAVQQGSLAMDVYPMSFHDAGSVAAANGFACAAEAGFGTAYYRSLFANRDLDWSSAQLTDLAGKVSAEVPDSFDDCLANGAHQAWVDSITTAADRAGVQQTPTVALDGNPVDLNTTTPEMLVAMIEKAAAAR